MTQNKAEDLENPSAAGQEREHWGGKPNRFRGSAADMGILD